MAYFGRLGIKRLDCRTRSMDGFNGIVGFIEVEGLKMIKDKLIDGKDLTGLKGRFRRRIVNMIKKKETTYDDYTVSPVIRQCYYIGVMN